MFQHTRESEMCISVMTVILKSLGVASASGEAAELFCRNRFGGAAVDMAFECGLVADDLRGWTKRQRGPAEVA